MFYKFLQTIVLNENATNRTYTETVINGNYTYTNTAQYNSLGYYVGTTYGYVNSNAQYSRSTSVEYKSYIKGQIGTETDGDFVTSYSYNAENFISGLTRSIDEIGYETEYAYNNNQLTSVTIDGIIYAVSYDGMGNITAVTRNGAAYLTYTYDSAGRLISENNVNLSYTGAYTYDEHGNVLTKTKRETQTPFSLTTTYVYEGDRLLGMTMIDGLVTTPYTSDAYGNLTSYDGKTLTWTQGTRLGSITNGNVTYRYSYDENGLRYKKETLSGNSVTSTSRYYLDGATIIAEDRDGELIQYYYDSTGVVGMRYNGTNYYFVKDIFGNVYQVLHQDGTRVAEYEYDAWGNCEIVYNPISLDNVSKNNIANVNPFRYRGYYMDTETGYYYLQSRYYDPSIRRFISSDNYDLIPTLAESGDLNLYAYCSNNPVMYTDPTGRSPVLQFIVSLLCYAGIFVAALFDEEIRADMNAIGWNPFNSNEEIVAQSSKVSFYEGVPVFMFEKDFGAFSFGIIGLGGNYRQDVEVLKHERGHNTQLMTMGLIKFLFFVALPSPTKNADETPWELSASILGGSELPSSASQKEKINAIKYYLYACSGLPILWIINFIEYLNY